MTSSETLCGSATLEHEGSEYRLSVTFERTEFTEHHPYGDTYASECFSEDEPTEYELDGQTTTREQLCHRFGADAVNDATERAMSNAE